MSLFDFGVRVVLLKMSTTSGFLNIKGKPLLDTFNSPFILPSTMPKVFFFYVNNTISI